MNLVADESVDRQIVEVLRQKGHNIIYIAEMDPGISDVLVFETANKNRCLLLTADKDFGEIVFRDKRLISDGVVLIRLAGLSSEMKGRVISEAIETYEAQLPARFTVVSPGKVRISSEA